MFFSRRRQNNKIICKTLLLAFILLSFFNKYTINSQGSDFINEDIYQIFDKNNRFHLANVSFSAEVLQNNRTFTIIQSVNLELVSHIVSTDWGIISLHFETELLYGAWSTNNDTMITMIRIPTPMHSEAYVKPGETVELTQNINASDEWNGDNFLLRPSFCNLELITKKQNIQFDVYVAFSFNVTGRREEPIINGKLYIDYEINPWIILRTELKLVLWLILIILGVIGLAIVGRIVVLIRRIILIQANSQKYRCIFLWREFSNIFKQIGWTVIVWYSFGRIIFSVQKLLEFKFDISFFIISILALVFIFIIPIIFRFNQLKKMRKFDEVNIRENNHNKIHSYLIFKNEILIPYPKITELLLLMLGTLVNRIMELFSEVFI